MVRLVRHAIRRRRRTRDVHGAELDTVRPGRGADNGRSIGPITSRSSSADGERGLAVVLNRMAGARTAVHDIMADCDRRPGQACGSTRDRRLAVHRRNRCHGKWLQLYDDLVMFVGFQQVRL